MVGLVKNSATSTCVDPTANQKLGTGRARVAADGSSFSGLAIRATFPAPLLDVDANRTRFHVAQDDDDDDNDEAATPDPDADLAAAQSEVAKMLYLPVVTR